MNNQYNTYKAKSLDDLFNTLKHWKDQGYDMSSEWNGYDDGNIYCHPDGKEWRCIECALHTF